MKGADWAVAVAHGHGWRVNDERRLRRLLNFSRGEIEVEVWTSEVGGITVVTMRRREPSGLRSYRDLPAQIGGTNKASKLANLLRSEVA